MAKTQGSKIVAIRAYRHSPAGCPLLTDADETALDLGKSCSHLQEMAVADAIAHFLNNPADIAASGADEPKLILTQYKL